MATPRKTAPVKAAPLNLVSIASGAKEVPAMPKRSSGGGSASSPFTELVVQTKQTGKPQALPAVPADQVKSLIAAVRRGASLADLGVSIAQEVTPAGVVVTLKGKERRERSA